MFWTATIRFTGNYIAVRLYIVRIIYIYFFVSVFIFNDFLAANAGLDVIFAEE